MKTVKFLTLITAIALLTFSCKKDGNETKGGGGIPSGLKVSPLVPTGKIVPVGERQFVLTGFSTGGDLRAADSQKWWEVTDGKIIMFDLKCAGQSFPDQSDDITGDDERFHAFSPDGKIFLKGNISDEPSLSDATWKWHDSKKDAFDITNFDPTTNKTETIIYYLTQLDEDHVTYVGFPTLEDVGMSSADCNGNVNIYVNCKKAQ
ncbi:MAG: hypothetical protein M9887_04155 [Chitinophagales bacterium]|nr:hypothetical protein [Chitinophagales bacterium]